MIIFCCNQVVRYGIVKITSLPYSLFPPLMTLNCVALWTVTSALIVNSYLRLKLLSSGVLHLDNSDVGNNIPSPINSPTTRPLILVRPTEILPHDETNTNELLKRVTSTTTPPNTTTTPPNTTWKTSHTIEWDSATCLTYRLLWTHSSRKLFYNKLP